jgi:hypothetical protein
MAETFGTLGEVRGEVAAGHALGPNTTLRDWLDAIA